MVAVVLHEIGHDLDGLAGRACAFERHVDERTVVHDARGVGEFLASAPCTLGDGQTMFVHIAYGGVGLGHLRDVAEILSGVPLDYLAHFAGRMLAAGTVIKLAIERMAVGGVCHKHRTVGRGLLARDETRTRKRLDRQQSRHSQKQ